MPILLGTQALYSLLIFSETLKLCLNPSLLTVCVMVVLALESGQSSDLSQTCDWLLFTKYWVARVEAKMSSLTLRASPWVQGRPSILIKFQACGNNFKCPDSGEISCRVLCHAYSHNNHQTLPQPTVQPTKYYTASGLAKIHPVTGCDIDSWPTITGAIKCEEKRSLIDRSAVSHWWWSSSKSLNCRHWLMTGATQC